MNDCVDWDVSQNYKPKAVLTSFVIVMILIYSFFGYLVPNAWQAFVITASCMYLIAKSVLIKGKIRLRHKWIFVLLIIFILLLLTTSLNSANPNSIWAAITTGSILFIGISLSAQSGWADNCLKYLLLFSLIHALFTIFSDVFPEVFSSVILPLLPNEVSMASADFMSLNLFAGITEQVGRNSIYLSVGMSVLVTKLVCQRSKFKTYVVILCIMMIALFLTGKRGPLLSNFLATVITIGIHAKVEKKNVIKKLFYFITTTIILVWILMLIMPDVAAPFRRFLEKADQGDLTSGRIDLYITAVSLFWQKPILGWGLEYFASSYNVGVHNVFLQLLCETGIFGAFVFILILVTNLIITVQTIKSNYISCNRKSDWPLLFSLYFQVFYCSYCMTGNPFSDRFILVIYMLTMAIPYSRTRNLYALGESIAHMNFGHKKPDLNCSRGSQRGTLFLG